MNNSTHSWFIIPFSFVVALMLTILPMPDWAIWMRPSWVLLVLICWVMTVPHRVNVGVAWIVGIFLDVLNGTLLGEHALALSIIAYLVARMHSRLLMFPTLQQGLIVLFLVLLYQFIIFCIQGFIGQPPLNWLYWSSAVTSMLLWPWVFGIIRGCRHRFRVV